MTISENIKNIREKFDLTQDELGKIAGVSGMAVSQWENDRAAPRMSTANRIADHLHIPVAEIVKASRDPKVVLEELPTDKRAELEEKFEGAKQSQLFILNSARAQDERVTMLRQICDECRKTYGIERPTLEFAYRVARAVLDCFDDMIAITEKLKLEWFLCEANELKNPYEDLLQFWTEKEYQTWEDVVIDSFVYETVIPAGNKITQMWTVINDAQADSGTEYVDYAAETEKLKEN